MKFVREYVSYERIYPEEYRKRVFEFYFANVDTEKLCENVFGDKNFFKQVICLEQYFVPKDLIPYENKPRMLVLGVSSTNIPMYFDVVLDLKNVNLLFELLNKSNPGAEEILEKERISKYAEYLSLPPSANIVYTPPLPYFVGEIIDLEDKINEAAKND